MPALVTINSQFGPISIVCEDDVVVRLILPNGDHPMPSVGSRPARELAGRARDLLTRYLDGQEIVFDVPTAAPGAPFFRAVHEQLRMVPYGQTISYRDLALRAGSPRACRAVGQAVARNPVPIIVPCHRVIAADGGPGGFGGGLELKRRLLELEGVTGVRFPERGDT